MDVNPYAVILAHTTAYTPAQAMRTPQGGWGLRLLQAIHKLYKQVGSRPSIVKGRMHQHISVAWYHTYLFCADAVMPCMWFSPHL